MSFSLLLYDLRAVLWFWASEERNVPKYGRPKAFPDSSVWYLNEHLVAEVRITFSTGLHKMEQVLLPSENARGTRQCPRSFI